MQKEEFRDMLLEIVDENHHQEVDEWLEGAEKEFERIAKATDWPIEKIRGFYRLFGIGMGLARSSENTKEQNNE